MTRPPIYPHINPDGTIHMNEHPKDCPFEGRRLIGTEVFHGHIAALVTARGHNERAGFKTKRIVMHLGHFRLVDTIDTLLLIEDGYLRRRGAIPLVRILDEVGNQQPYMDEIARRIFGLGGVDDNGRVWT